MALTAPIEIGTLLTRSPEMCDNRPRVAGTRITVHNIIGIYKQDATPEDIARRKSLSLAQVYAALTYYYANRAEIEADMTQDAIDHDRLEQEWRQMRAEGRA